MFAGFSGIFGASSDSGPRSTLSGKLIATYLPSPVKKSAKKIRVVRPMKAVRHTKANNNAKLEKGAGNGGGHPSSVKSSNDAADQILTVPMLAEYLLCHPSTIYRLLKNKRIPGFRVGSDWRFRRSAIDQWLNKATIPSGH